MFDYNLLKDPVNIIALHRVLRDTELASRLAPSLEMELSESKFERFIQETIDNGFRFASLDEALYEDIKADEKIIALTFDDGYIDFVDIIYPLLKKYQIPACLYLISGYPDRQCLHSYGIIEDFVSKQNDIGFEFKGHIHHFAAISHQEKSLAIQALDELTKTSINNINEMFAFFASMGVNKELVAKQRGVNWEQVIELDMDPLITIGAHTFSHPRLSQLTEIEVKHELEDSKSRLEEILGHAVKHFSYPYGDYSEAVINAVRKAGYESAATIESRGYLGDNLFNVPRYWLDGNLTIVDNK